MIIQVPGKVSHDVWILNNAPRLIQKVQNTDFEIEVKFDSELRFKYQLQGLIVEENSENYLRFDVYTDGEKIYLFSAVFSNGTGTRMLNKEISGGAPYFLRVKRSGDQWTYYYSTDGIDWLPQTTFFWSLNVESVGFFAGNHGTGDEIPPHLGVVDYFYNSADPIMPEDGDPNIHTVTIIAEGNGEVIKDPNLVTYTSGAQVSLTATPAVGWSFASWNGEYTGTTNPINITMTRNLAYVAGFNYNPEIATWSYLSSSFGDLPVPANNTGESGLRVIDLDKNGEEDLIITAWESTESIIWYRRENGLYTKFVIASNFPTNLTHGEEFQDIDGDGDIDLIFGQADEGNEIYWWENPYPDYEPNTLWPRYTVRDEGENKYHDNIWGDFDGDGVDEFVSWNQKGQQLLLFEVPADPKVGPWPATPIFTWNGDLYDEYSGIDVIDVNLDGKVDIVGGGGWFEHLGGTTYVHHVVDDFMRYARVVAGQLIPGGRPELVFAMERPRYEGDSDLSPGPLKWFEWKDGTWKEHVIVGSLPRTHSLQLGDINNDGHLDIMIGEMGHWGYYLYPPNNPDAKVRVFYGSGSGFFTEQVVHIGQGSLEAQLSDLDGDGDLDIASKPFRHNIPRIDIWINEIVPNP
jgi:regulation of enolase protein 1 (concanavalin A-like superfamily)